MSIANSPAFDTEAPDPHLSRFGAQQKIRKADPMAAGGRDVLHGLGRDLRHRRHRAWRGIWPRDPHPPADPHSLEPAHRVHDRRTVERAARRRRLSTPGCGGRWETSGDSRKRGCRWWPAFSTWRSIPRCSSLYLTRLFPWFAVNHRGVMVGLAVVLVCAALEPRWNPSGGDDLDLAVLPAFRALRA